MSFDGTFVALATPFKEGRFDEAAFRRLIDWVKGGGCEGIVPCGTTGEAATLEFEEHKKIIEIAVEHAKGLKVIAGAGSNSTKKACELVRHAEKAGADGALVITPYYNKPTQKGLYEHYKAVSESSPIPIVIYNVPSRTSVNISAETVVLLAHDFKNIVGIKEASGDLKQISTIIKDTPEKFSVISGDDFLTYFIMTIGGKGVISVTANILPKKVSDMVRACLKSDFETAKKLHFELMKINQTLFIETNPIPIKSALKEAGVIPSDEVRLPLSKISPKNLDVLKNVLKEYEVT